MTCLEQTPGSFIRREKAWKNYNQYFIHTYIHHCDGVDKEKHNLSQWSGTLSTYNRQHTRVWLISFIWILRLRTLLSNFKFQTDLRLMTLISMLIFCYQQYGAQWNWGRFLVDLYYIFVCMFLFYLSLYTLWIKFTNCQIHLLYYHLATGTTQKESALFQI